MTDDKKRRKRIAAYISEVEKRGFLMLAQQAGVSESRYLAHWITTILEHKGLPTASNSGSAVSKANDQYSTASGEQFRKSQVFSVRLSASDLAPLRAEADKRRLSTGGLLSGILRGRYLHDLYFSDAEVQALLGSIIALNEMRTELARLQRAFGYRPLEALEPVRQQCQKLQRELETQAEAVRNLLAGNIKTWKQTS